MKTKATQTVTQDAEVQLEERFTSLSDTSYCIDLVAGGKCYGRHLIEQKMLGPSLRLINKLQLPPEPATYKAAKSLDTTGWVTKTAGDFGDYVDLSGLLTPAADEVVKA